MSHASTRDLLRIGVIGLGRLWESRHKPALLKPGSRIRVVAVFDQVMRRAEHEAAALSCYAAEGLHDLIDRPDVDAVYLLGPQWFGCRPVEIACAAGKPIYCAPPIFADPDVEALALCIERSGVAFMPEFARRFYPSTLRLKELLATKLGKPRLVLGQTRLLLFDRYGNPGPMSQIAPAPLVVDPGGFLLDWCRFVFENEPIDVRLSEAGVVPNDAEGPAFIGLEVAFPDGAAADMHVCRYQRTLWGDASSFLPRPGLQIFAERGAVWIEPSDRIQWSDSDGVHEEIMPMDPTVGETLNDHFRRLVRGEHTLAPSIRDALAVARRIAPLRPRPADDDASAQVSRTRSNAEPVRPEPA